MLFLKKKIQYSSSGYAIGSRFIAEDGKEDINKGMTLHVKIFLAQK